jgi:ABC-type glutathione transport system ATPase component
VASTVLEIIDLKVRFPSDDGEVKAVDGVSFALQEGETLGVVGESGSGKSVTAMAVLGILPKRAKISGQIQFRGRDLIGLREGDLRDLRGNHVAMVFQDALASLNPVFRIGDQIAEAISVHRDLGRQELQDRVVELLDLVGIPSPTARADQYPHELSGGMRQRVALARAFAQDADVLLMDEPFGALDAMTRDLLHHELEQLWTERDLTVLFVTHNVREAVRLGDQVVVLTSRPGRVAEVFDVDIARPRRIESPEVSSLAGTITDRLRQEVRRHGRH